jgi:hypothetical protein
LPGPSLLLVNPVNDAGQEISQALKERKLLHGLRLYHDGLRIEQGGELRHRFGETMRFLEAANVLDFEHLSKLHAGVRRDSRRRLRGATVERILELAGDKPMLRVIGSCFSRLVLAGTLQQRFCSKLATEFGDPAAIPDSVRDEVMTPLIGALQTVLRVGAPVTRDDAIEGLGALLKYFGDPAEALPRDPRVPVRTEESERFEDFAAQTYVSEDYFDRLDRRRLMVLTVAGHGASRENFVQKLAEPMADVIAALRRKEKWNETIPYALWERSDLLRILPALTRQRQGTPLPQKPSALLTAAVAPLRLDELDPPEVVIAYARYRESVFRTIEAALRRDWKWTKFDDAIASAVKNIPRTVAGSPVMCNAEIRATVALVRTAVRIVRYSEEKPSSTRRSLEELFRGLDMEPTPWANHGIAEGCFRALPDLLAKRMYNELTAPALRALCTQLLEVPPHFDLVKVHRRLVVDSCFRRILRTLADTLQESQVAEAVIAERPELREIDRRLHVLLRFPTPANLRGASQKAVFLPGMTPTDIAEPVIAGIGFESTLLRRSRSIFARWRHLSTVEKVLLARILAAQLHAVSRDLPQLRRHDVLRRVFTTTPGVSLGDEEAMRLTWELLSSLPPEASDTADMEIQRFVEYRDRQAEEDLPGYVLAMISPDASGRIAGAIARELDLNLRQDDANCAKLLYQVMLHGPAESIFDHLLPRVADPDKRSVITLFRRHVANVRRSGKDEKQLDLQEILKHVDSLIADLAKVDDKILQDLRGALTLYRDFTHRSENVWELLAEGWLAKLFSKFDVLAQETDDAKYRKLPLTEFYERQLSSMRRDVLHYLTLPVGNFSARIEALRKARDSATQIEKSLPRQPGLQPPERILLVALMQHLQGLFDDTVTSFCEEPRRRIEEEVEHDDAKVEFWLLFCDERPAGRRLPELGALTRSKKESSDVVNKLSPEERMKVYEEVIARQPAEFPRQREKFEEYFVEWMESHLDVNALKRTLRRRWPPEFKFVYATVTSFERMTMAILAICGWVIATHLVGWHEIEGLSFLVVSAIVIVSIGISFMHGVRRWFRWLITGVQYDEEKPGYWFNSLLPRLARLTAVPMALVVEFDHSYEFPMHASTWALVLLMILSFLTTRFFVMREIVDDKEHPGVFHMTGDEKHRVSQIVALALAHSFGIAVLLAAIFASSHPHQAIAHEAPVHGGSGAKWLDYVAALFYPLDEVSPPHQFSPFLGVLPRDVVFDLSAFVHVPPELASHLRFAFYPTIILAWTALGLFFGVFLEGFMGGKRIRGGDEAKREEH